MVAIVRRALHDSYGLQRYVDAQEHVDPQVLAELRAVIHDFVRGGV